MSIESRPVPLDCGDRPFRARADRRTAPDVTVRESRLLGNGVVVVAVLGWAAFVYAAYVLGLR